jgi:16S rRNA (cytosine1402-N4)-methyltransferase
LQSANREQILVAIFQALRIEVNHEMQALKDFLEGGLQILRPGGRFVLLPIIRWKTEW